MSRPRKFKTVKQLEETWEENKPIVIIKCYLPIFQF